MVPKGGLEPPRVSPPPPRGSEVCVVTAYDREAPDALPHFDGEDEFVIYLAPVGKRTWYALPAGSNLILEF